MSSTFKRCNDVFLMILISKLLIEDKRYAIQVAIQILKRGGLVCLALPAADLVPIVGRARLAQEVGILKALALDVSFAPRASLAIGHFKQMGPRTRSVIFVLLESFPTFLERYSVQIVFRAGTRQLEGRHRV